MQGGRGALGEAVGAGRRARRRVGGGRQRTAFSPTHCAMVGWPRSRASLKTRLGLYLPGVGLRLRLRLRLGEATGGGRSTGAARGGP